LDFRCVGGYLSFIPLLRFHPFRAGALGDDMSPREVRATGVSLLPITPSRINPEISQIR